MATRSVELSAGLFSTHSEQVELHDDDIVDVVSDEVLIEALVEDGQLWQREAEEAQSRLALAVERAESAEAKCSELYIRLRDLVSYALPETSRSDSGRIIARAQQAESEAHEFRFHLNELVSMIHRGDRNRMAMMGVRNAVEEAREILARLFESRPKDGEGDGVLAPP